MIDLVRRHCVVLVLAIFAWLGWSDLTETSKKPKEALKGTLAPVTAADVESRVPEGPVVLRRDPYAIAVRAAPPAGASAETSVATDPGGAAIAGAAGAPVPGVSAGGAAMAPAVALGVALDLWRGSLRPDARSPFPTGDGSALPAGFGALAVAAVAMASVTAEAASVSTAPAPVPEGARARSLAPALGTSLALLVAGSSRPGDASWGAFVAAAADAERARIAALAAASPLPPAPPFVLDLESTLSLGGSARARLNGQTLGVGGVLVGLDPAAPPVVESIEGTVVVVGHRGERLVLDLLHRPRIQVGGSPWAIAQASGETEAKPAPSAAPAAAKPSGPAAPGPKKATYKSRKPPGKKR